MVTHVSHRARFFPFHILVDANPYRLVQPREAVEGTKERQRMMEWIERQGREGKNRAHST